MEAPILFTLFTFSIVTSEVGGSCRLHAALVEDEDDAFVDVLGDKWRLPGPESCKAVVLIFIGYDCPISNAYAPEIARLRKEYEPKKVAFCMVYADADLTKEAARKHAKEYGYSSPAILDPQMKLARKVGASVKPEAAVLSPTGELLYLGRINDLYSDFGKRRLQPTTHDLKNALDAILSGKSVPVARTKAIGCYIEVPPRNK
ncbi:MAG: redoxin family protein [Gemmataceae bacterium]|nr:redoxin family protein [Gemmataceae bacterium]MCS7269761.1 redoxin family protein [Gemmataceae bacterium]MDW8242531.1 redoxin family protein [Thermogemmata sp.]